MNLFQFASTSCATGKFQVKILEKLRIQEISISYIQELDYQTYFGNFNERILFILITFKYRWYTVNYRLTKNF